MTHFTSVNPYNGQTIDTHALMTNAEINAALQLAEKAFVHWRNEPIANRIRIISNVAEQLLAHKASLALLITNEMGKLYTEAIAEVEKCATVCQYYATHATTFLQPESIAANYAAAHIHYEPLGAVLGIMPWNFPFWQVFRYAVPTLVAGNVTLLKHAPNVCGCAKAIAQIWLAAGAPEGVFQTLITEVDTVNYLLQAPIVQAVTFTGSNKAGSIVASIAGQQVKKSVLELGGSDAMMVLPDANMQQAASVALQSRLLNAGQSCIGPKRIIVVSEGYDAFMQALLQLLPAYTLGNPMLPETRIAPLARIDLAQQLHQQLQQSIQLGAQLSYGTADFDGCKVAPVLLTQVQPHMPAFAEETFGPLIAVTTAANEQAALALANQSKYGLAASIWTSDAAKAAAFANQLAAGAVFINAMVKSDPRLPFGGIKQSGYGRELHKQGLLEFVNIKTIVSAMG